MTTTSALGQLQQLDSANDKARKRVAELDAALANESLIVIARKRLDSATSHSAAARGELRSREEETRLNEDRMKDVEGRLYGGRVRNPKELENLERELVMYRHQHERLDEATLALMDELEKTESAEQLARLDLQRLEAERSKAAADWSQERQTLVTEIAERQKAAEAARNEVPNEILESYDRMRRRMPLAAVPVKHGLCGGCGVGVPEQAAAQAHEGQIVARCDSCGRILYVE